MARPTDECNHGKIEAACTLCGSNQGKGVTLEIFQSDWIPGFAAFLDDGSLQEGAPAHIALNLGSLLCAVESKDFNSCDLPYIIAETLMHETIHALEAWAKVEFNEERVEELLSKYREKYGR